MVTKSLVKIKADFRHEVFWSLKVSTTLYLFDIYKTPFSDKTLCFINNLLVVETFVTILNFLPKETHYMTKHKFVFTGVRCVSLSLKVHILDESVFVRSILSLIRLLGDNPCQRHYQSFKKLVYLISGSQFFISLYFFKIQKPLHVKI